MRRELGISPELAASRRGHKDAGHLLVTVYAETRRENLRAKLQAIAAEGGIDARLASRLGTMKSYLIVSSRCATPGRWLPCTRSVLGSA